MITMEYNELDYSIKLLLDGVCFMYDKYATESIAFEWIVKFERLL